MVGKNLKKRWNMFVWLVYSIDSALKIGEKYYPQVYLEQCKYKVKKREMRNFIDYETDLDSDYDSD